MRLALRILAVVAAIGFVAASVQPLLAQEKVVVEERSAVVLKKVGNTVILRNDKGEIKKYENLPEGFTLYIDGKPAKFEDLQVGMKLHAVRFQDVPEPTIVTQAEAEELDLPADTAPPPKPAPAPAAPAPAAAAPAPAPEAAPAPAAELPATGSVWPLVGLVGIALVLAGLGLGAVGRRARA
jgi:LPXTG-motif cell wall-anchored protein